MIIIDNNGLESNLVDYGIHTLSFQPFSPQPRTNDEVIEGREGIIHLNTVLDARTIQASFFMTSQSDFHFSRNQVFQLFDGKTMFYLIDDNEPHKRWYVKTVSAFIVERIGATDGEFSIDFISPSPYAESVSSTLNPSAVMQVKQENFNDPPVQYEFSTANFSIWNDGDVSVNPRQQDLTITFTGASTNLSIKNVTTGDEWALTGDTIAGDVIKLDGIRSTKNNVSVFGDTNRQLLTLARGRNNFEITGSTDFTISFDFRFYYL